MHRGVVVTIVDLHCYIKQAMEIIIIQSSIEFCGTEFEKNLIMHTLASSRLTNLHADTGQVDSIILRARIVAAQYSTLSVSPEQLQC